MVSAADGRRKASPERPSDGRCYFFLGLGGSVATYVRALSTHTAACSVVQDAGNAR